MEEGREILEPYQLHYSDLLSLSSIHTPPHSSPSSSLANEREIERLRAVMETLGPSGPGLLAITGVPNASKLRNTLLLLARDLALLNNDDRKRILKNHGLGSDVPLKNLDRCVSSFAMQLKYGHGLDGLEKNNSVEGNFNADGFESMDNHFKDLGGSFRELGFCMMDMGLRLARICDRAIGETELEKSILESSTAKGRLIHYHSSLDTRIIKGAGKRKGSKKAPSNSKHETSSNEKSANKSRQMYKDGNDGGSNEKCSELWQQWHYDYGTFTVLTSPMFIRPRCCLSENREDSYAESHGLECPPPSGHTYLQILYPNKNTICTVKAPPESFIIQVGESADILSKRKLRSTLHSVTRPIALENLSRETFVVFLHPAWNKVFDISDYPMEQLLSNDLFGENGERYQGDESLIQEIHKIIPPLSSRLKDGMTFAEFSRQTTRQYYGGSGLQSNS